MTTKPNTFSATVSTLAWAAEEWQRGDVVHLRDECRKHLTGKQEAVFRAAINTGMTRDQLASAAVTALSGEAY